MLLAEKGDDFGGDSGTEFRHMRSSRRSRVATAGSGVASGPKKIENVDLQCVGE
jgi:hypothetical protein